MDNTSSSPALGGQTSWFGQPRGLMTLFFTEMWERFSYYGMRAILILYLAKETIGNNPGLGYDDATAGAIYGMYTALVYVLTLIGGWVADNLWGQRKAVFVGGCVIAAGHFSMAFPSQVSFFGGLLLIIIGTGLLKGNVSTMVGDLYPEGGAQRDKGFSIYYMGINIGALLGPLACGYGEIYNWHLGFSLAGIGMVLGLIQYKMTEKHLGDIGIEVSNSSNTTSASKFYLIAFVVTLLIAAVSYYFLGMQGVAAAEFAKALGYIVLLVVAAFFAYLLLSKGHTSDEKKKLTVIFWLFLLVAVFWSGFEQAGSSLNLFATDITDRVIGGWEMPAAFLQSVNALFIIIFAPIFGSLWVWLATRKKNPSTPIKFALALLLLAAGFFVISWGSANASETNKAGMHWLIVMYFFHTAGELCISPVGLSSVTKLAPKSRMGQMMGIWFVGAALGNLIAGLVAGGLEDMAASALFGQVAMIIGGVGIVALLASPFVRKLMGDVE